MFKWFKKENIIPLGLAVILTVVALVDSKFFNNTLLTVIWVIAGILFTFVITSIFFAAGFVVIKALFRVGAGLTLLIFLGQTYCDLDTKTDKGVAALKSLLVVGFIYVLYTFFSFLYKTLVKNLNQYPEKKWSLEKILTLIAYLLFTCFFVWLLYQVVYPIILSLCI